MQAPKMATRAFTALGDKGLALPTVGGMIAAGSRDRRFSRTRSPEGSAQAAIRSRRIAVGRRAMGSDDSCWPERGCSLRQADLSCTGYPRIEDDGLADAFRPPLSLG